MKRQFPLAVILSWATALAAGAGGIGGPVVGYVLEPAEQAVRPILGIPGASLMGGRIPVGIEMRAAALSPRQDYILAAGAGGALSVIELHDGAPLARAVEGARAGVERMALSPGGGMAAAMAGGALQVLKGLPAQPAVAGTVETGEAGAFAVSDDGAVLFEAGGTLFAAAPGGEPQPVPFAGQASLIVFLEGTRDALVAGRDDNQVALVRDVTGAPAYRRLAGPGDGIDRPVGLAFANGRALVASAGSGSVATIDVESGAAAAAACGCTVTGLERMRGAAVYRASDLGAGPLWLFDGGGEEGRFLFVPPPAGEVEQ